MDSVFDYTVKTITGEELSLEKFRGKVMLFVNTASRCGFTPQYAALEGLYRRYGAQGLVVLGFPCNQFGAQEPGTDEEIKEFCDLRYEISFPMFAKVDVNGESAEPLYEFLKANDPTTNDDAEAQRIKWNFTKFIVGPDGEPVSRHEPTVLPKQIAANVERLLGK